MNTFSRAQRILEAAANSTTDTGQLNQIEEVQFFAGYAEHGYTDPESGLIATGNWNRNYRTGDNTMKRVVELFDKLGIECEWSDEWDSCSDCGKLFRTSADSYGWQRAYYDFGGERICCECVRPEEVLEDLEGKSHSALTLDIDPSEYGYVKANDEDYENGWYGGQNDSPEEIAKSLRELGVERYLFVIDSTGQFDMHFSVWVHESEMDLVTKEPEGKCKIDPADALKSSLESASKQMGELKGDGIKYAKCNADGTADVRLVSGEEFINGIKE